MRRSVAAAVPVLVAALVGASCAGRQDTTPDRIRSEAALSCDAAAADLEAVDVDALPEAELQAAMETADNLASVCRDAFLAEADTLAERVIAIHRSRQMTVHARYFEAALATRFDGDAHFCEIIAETFALLVADAADIEVALADPLTTREDTAMLTQLRDLDLEAIDVLMLTAESACRSGVTVAP